MKIVVTGCCGFIGHHLSIALLERGDDVFGIDIINDYYSVESKLKNLDKLKKYKNFIFFKEDISETKLIEKIKPEIVVNLAAEVGVRWSLQRPQDYIKTNIFGFENIMTQSRLAGVKLVVYASSSSVYGENKKLPFSEVDILDNIVSPYALTKKINEDWAKMCWDIYNQRSIGLRFFTVYGPGGRPDMFPHKLLTSLITQTEFQKYGNGDTSRDYTYIDDIVRGLLLSIDSNLNCEVLNLGGTKTTTLNDFISLCESITGKIAKFKQIENQLGDVSITYADISKARSLLGWSPGIDLKTGITNFYTSLIQDL